MSYTNPAGYDRFMGRWSARLTTSFLRFAELRDGYHVLDVGCGTGSLSRAVVSIGPATRVTGVDPEPEYVAYARRGVSSSRAQFQRGAAESLPFPDRTFDAVLALLVLQDFVDPVQAISEMARVTRPSGVVAACQWDFENGLPMLSLVWKAAEAVAPDAAAKWRQESPRPRRPTLNELGHLWRESRLGDVTTVTLDLPMYYPSFHDYWEPFLGGSTPMSAFAAALDADTDGRLVRVLREMIPGIQPDGSFVLPARAWLIKGKSPAIIA